MAEPIDTGNKTISGRTIWNDPETGEDYSERSTTFEIEGKHYTMPTVSEDGRQHTDDQIRDYVKEYGPIDYLTGEKLPEFRYREDAIQYAISRSSTRKPKMAEGGDVAAQTEEESFWEKYNPLTGSYRKKEPTSVQIARTGIELTPVGGAMAIAEEVQKDDTSWLKVAGLTAAEVARTVLTGAGPVVRNMIRFDKKALDIAAKQNDKSREILVDMPIEDFLQAAKKEVSQTKLDNTRDLVSKGKPFESIPSLSIKNNGDGTAKVTDHDGRHR